MFVRMCTEIKTLPADESIDWPLKVVDILRDLSLKCVADYKYRIDSMERIIHQLEELKDVYV